MPKKIIISVEIEPNDDAVDIQGVRKALSMLGRTSFIHAAQVETVGITDCADLTERICVFVSADPDQPYRLASRIGDTGGRELSAKDVDLLRAQGVCTRLHAEYPRASHCGTPFYAVDESLALGLVGDHGFKVANENFEVSTEDRGDDGMDEVWFAFAIQPEVAAVLSQDVLTKPDIAIIEAYATQDMDGPSYASLTVTQKFLNSLRSMQSICEDNDLTEVRCYHSPDHWGQGSIGECLNLSCPELVVTKGAFWFVDVPRHTSYHIETRAVGIDEFIAAFDERQGVTRYFGENVDDLKEMVDDESGEEERKAA